jgi:hypothetical protein
MGYFFRWLKFNKLATKQTTAEDKDNNINASQIIACHLVM